MKHNLFIILLYFSPIILIGTILLFLPISWNGNQQLKFIDAFFTSTSAVCVTGLITVDTAQYSLFGKIIILLLIQFGGLGIISFTTLYIVLISRKISIKGIRHIKEYYLDSIEYDPIQIIKQIVIMTLIIEFIGAIILFFGFYNTLGKNSIFFAIFHSVSAFCNAGFSLFSNNLEDYKSNTIVNITIMVLIILGGIGFVVLRDIGKKLTREKKILSSHTKIVLITTFFLIIGGALLFFLFEYNNILKDYTLKDRIMISLFQSVTPRTAGFNTVTINNLIVSTKLILLPLMFIGGAPGSISGGIKVTTFFLLIQILFKKFDTKYRITVFKRKISQATIFKCLIFLIRIFCILLLSIFLLFISEYLTKPEQDISLLSVIFECFSAIGTVGLSLGITPSLSFLGKLIIIITMMIGRFGLIIITMSIFEYDKKNDYLIEDEVLIG